MIATLESVFSLLCGHVVFDEKLAREVAKFRLGFANKNPEHTAFFGGNLTGVHIVRFTPADTGRWFSEILEIDEEDLSDLIETIPAINTDFFVSSDPFNLSVVWVMHGFWKSNLPKEKKEAAMVEAGLCLLYKFICGRLYNYFKYPTSPEIAQAIYASMSAKFAIKQYGSWQKVLEARAQDMINRTNTHWKAIENLKDIEVVKFLNDTHGRMNDMIKNIMAISVTTTRSGSKIATVSNTMEHEGEQILKDKTNALSNYTRYLESVIGDKDSFIKDELMSIILDLMPRTSPKHLKQCLSWMSDNYRTHHDAIVERCMEITMIHSFEYFSQNKQIFKQNKDLSNLLKVLRGVYMASRAYDPYVLEMREKAEKIAIEATHIRNPSIQATLRTSILLYLVLRAFSIGYYSRG